MSDNTPAQLGNVIQPGQDHPAHAEQLHASVAASLSAATNAQIKPEDVNPQSNEDQRLEDLNEMVAAFNPTDPATVRTVPNATAKKSGFLDILLKKLRSKNPNSDIKEVS